LISVQDFGAEEIQKTMIPGLRWLAISAGAGKDFFLTSAKQNAIMTQKSLRRYTVR
jgi:hypothetical protein